jgi:Protein of unknown function (DUF3040)
MLSDHERYVLESIEHGLYVDDPEFANAFRTGRRPRVRRMRITHWPSFLLALGGLVMIIVGAAVRLDPLWVEGIVVGLTGVGYGRWQRRLAKDRPVTRRRRTSWPRRGPWTRP